MRNTIPKKEKSEVSKIIAYFNLLDSKLKSSKKKKKD